MIKTLLTVVTVAMAMPIVLAQDVTDAPPANDPPVAAAAPNDATTADENTEEAAWLRGPFLQYVSAWQQLIDGAKFAEAAELAEAWALEAQRRFGEDAVQVFVPYVRTGQAYEAAGENAKAARAYGQAIKLGERRMGVFDPRVTEPLTGLGRVLAKQGEHEAAVSQLMRAKDITHRNAGIFNDEQTEIVDILTQSYVGLGELRQATREQYFIFSAQEKLYGPDALELVPALQKWAQWNARINRIADARDYFQRAMQIQENHYGPNDLRLVETLNLIARSFYRNPSTSHPREGAAALRRAVEIYKAQDFVDQADLLRAQTRLGDWYMLSGLRSQSMKEYQASVDEALASGVDEKLLDSVFGRPKLLRSNRVPIGVLARQVRQVADGPRHILVEFDVDKRGRARNIRIVEDTVDLVSVVRIIRERISLAVFRPRFENGAPADTLGVRKLYQFEVEPQAGSATVSATDAGVDAEAETPGADEP